MNVLVWYKCVQVLVFVLIAVAFGSHGASTWRNKRSSYEPPSPEAIGQLIDPLAQSEQNDELESKKVVAKSVFNIPVRSPPNRCAPGYEKLANGECAQLIRGSGGGTAVSETAQSELLKEFYNNRRKPSRNRHRTRPTTTTMQELVPTEMTEASTAAMDPGSPAAVWYEGIPSSGGSGASSPLTPEELEALIDATTSTVASPTVEPVKTTAPVHDNPEETTKGMSNLDDAVLTGLEHLTTQIPIISDDDDDRSGSRSTVKLIEEESQVTESTPAIESATAMTPRMVTTKMNTETPSEQLGVLNVSQEEGEDNVGNDSMTIDHQVVIDRDDKEKSSEIDVGDSAESKVVTVVGSAEIEETTASAQDEQFPTMQPLQTTTNLRVEEATSTVGESIDDDELDHVPSSPPSEFKTEAEPESFRDSVPQSPEEGALLREGAKLQDSKPIQPQTAYSMFETSPSFDATKRRLSQETSREEPKFVQVSSAEDVKFIQAPSASPTDAKFIEAPSSSPTDAKFIIIKDQTSRRRTAVPQPYDDSGRPALSDEKLSSSFSSSTSPPLEILSPEKDFIPSPLDIYSATMPPAPPPTEPTIPNPFSLHFPPNSNSPSRSSSNNHFFELPFFIYTYPIIQNNNTKVNTDDLFHHPDIFNPHEPFS